MNNDLPFGRKISFFELVSEKEYWIEIPIIQRDYAQGRENTEDIRQHFLKTLKAHLLEDKPLDLDFIYGSIEAKTATVSKFVPLDGQQRLTTLFLLHWYLALKDDQIDSFRAVASAATHSKFTYETRISSREFCNALLSNPISLPESAEHKLSGKIRNYPWYFLSWDNDPTISSMLKMLDAVHKLFFDTQGYYQKLTRTKKPIITFQFIELKNFGLSDTLYIKMNSRGKVLTDFENFKAKFEQILEQHDKSSNTKLKDTFSIKIDTVWTDLFWQYRDQKNNTFDKKIMNLFRLLFLNQYALKEKVSNRNLQILFEKKIELNFYKYEILKCFDLESVTNILAQMELLADNEHKLAKHISSLPLFSEQMLFEKVIDPNTNVNITEALQFHALYQYIIYNKTSLGIDHWMRVIRNLTENTIYNEVSEYEASLKSIENLLPHSNAILTYLAAEKSRPKSFWGPQVEEEKIKATLMLKDHKWQKAFAEIEDHPYFNGQIGFLLKFSGISQNINLQDLKNWDLDNSYYNNFISYSNKAAILFGKDGIKPFPDFLFERALLSVGDYMLRKKKNYSFLINGLERDISWKKLLRDDNKERSHLKILLDSISDYDNLESELENIIASASVTDWRRHFIEYPEMIASCGNNKFVRFDESDEILLLEKLQTNGTHREYYSFALYLKLLKMNNTAGYITSNSVESLKYINHINGKRISIAFYIDEYHVKTNDELLNFTEEDDIIDYLKEQNIITDNP
ncbi:DUF262 domain-containing protein [Flavobacterium sp. 17A]|uniref:DUF262 domain-containing protein n=1 Tax=Flavobacterium potami TaxID=2872310 RepID=A0A9X1HAW6_9FLAO|nr:DUF262 domain-containing protein [Flavobacterium potami]MBZ4035355.1 DUF262 domain-containing protein [Flavobacterium potami]